MGLWLIVSEGLSEDLLLSLLAKILMGVGVQTHRVQKGKAILISGAFIINIIGESTL